MTAERLDDFFAGRCSTVELLEVAARHLAAVGGADGERADRRFVDALGTVEQPLPASADELAREAREAARRVAELDAMDPCARPLRCMLDGRFHTPAVVEHLLDRVVAELEARTGAEWGGAERSIDGALPVHTLAASLDPARYGAAKVRGLQAEVWVVEAMGALDTGEAESAAEGLAMAERLARGCDARSSVRRAIRLGRARLAFARRELALGRRRLRAALRWAVGGGRWHWPLRTALATLLRREGREGCAIELLQDLELPPESPAEVHAARELVRSLCQVRRFDEVSRCLEAWRGRGQRADLARVALLGSLAQRGRGAWEEALRALQGAREELLDLGLGFDAAWATAWGMGLALERGRNEELLSFTVGLDRFAGCADLRGDLLGLLSQLSGDAWRGRLQSSSTTTLDRRLTRRAVGLAYPPA